MDSSSTKPNDVAFHFPGMIRVLKDGRVERLRGTDFVPATVDPPNSGVSSKDVTLIPESNVSARLYLPKLTQPDLKLPLLVYFHGGSFCISSPFTSLTHNHVSAVVAEANVVAVSVSYRLAPEHPIPTAYKDSWAALQWVTSHRENGGPEAWLNDHADFERVFLGGEGAGANIVHNLAMAAGNPGLDLGLDIVGAALVHPFFWGSDPIGSEALNPDAKADVDSMWPFLCPVMPSSDDPRINPVSDGAPSLAWLGCKRVLICVAERDILKDRGWLYYDALGRSGWMGVVEIEETEGEDHGFHLYDMGCEKAQELIKTLGDFYNRDMPPLI